ncbi:FtsK/SpoIIIE domain-containing protein [Streptomyces roseicoloratus]|uniref:FtsK/SpoIIIE domain-containing protein n=1 Tax=Streptomyces roseicoloratus TaxID=2508722 RepID=UPI001009E64D|nr:FtsK/SpoIIIE domain-containing protein [Streptomyces roseicoloratus]
MQIRLTVLAPHAGHGLGRACDVLVTAPAGTELAAVASSLATAVSGPDTSSSGTTVLYAGGERLDSRRCLLGEPPLVDGAVLSLQVPGPDDAIGEGAPARLHVVAGPDAGGVHLLHGGAIRIGRSVDADVPLDDPDVSRAHCTVTVGPDGRVTVTDEGSTNGTALDGAAVGPRPVRFPPGGTLRVGESALRLTGHGGPSDAALATAPDGEGHLRVTLAGDPAGTPAEPGPAAYAPAHGGAPVPGARDGSTAHAQDATHGQGRSYGQERTPGRGDGEDTGAGLAHARAEEPAEPEAGIESHSRNRQPRRRGLGAWARRLAGARDDARDGEYGVAPVPVFTGARPGTAPGGDPGSPPDTWPDPAAVLLTALGPGPRLWERDAGHPEALVVRLGTTDRADLSGVPVTVGLREVGSLGLAGPAPRLAGLARSVVAQLAALHAPGDLEIVLVSADRNRPLDERRRAWAWLGWLPHTRPAHGQDCRLLLAYDREQAHARFTELTRRLDDGPLGPGWPSADKAAVAEAAARHEGPATVVIVDGDPGTAALRETAARLAGAGPASGIHLLCLAEAPAASPSSPVAATYETACAASLAFRECGAAALLSGDVATALRLLRTAGGRAAGHGTVGVVDAVSVAWAERFGRALAPLRTETAGHHGPGRAAAALPPSARLLDELGLARATPASLMARWASAADGTAVLGAGPRGPVAVDLTQEGPHLLVEGPAGSGRTELLRAIAASLAAGARPDRLGLLLVDGAGGERGEGLAACTELPHVTEHLVASDPVRMREFAQALGAELKRRAELLGDTHFADRRSARLIGQRSASPAESVPAAARVPEARTAAAPAAPAAGGTPPPGSDLLADRASGRTLRVAPDGAVGDAPGNRAPRSGAFPLGDTASGRTPRPREVYDQQTDTTTYRTPPPGADLLGDRPSGRTLRLTADALGDTPSSRTDPVRSGPAAEGAGALPRLVVLVDDFDALVAPALGAPGRPAAGSVVRALEAVARNGARLGVHLIAASARPDRTADTELAHGARLRIVLDPPPASPGPDAPQPGRGRLGHPDGRVTPFQAGRVTGRIPRTATLRPTVVPLEWERMGDPPARRPVRELGNGPTDLALLASALDRAARSVEATPIPPLVSPTHA